MPVALDAKRPIPGCDSFAAMKDPIQQWLEVIPKLAPVLLCRSSERARMPQADRWSVSVVIKGQILLAPEHYDLGTRGKHDVDRRL